MVFIGEAKIEIEYVNEQWNVFSDSLTRTVL